MDDHTVETWESEDGRTRVRLVVDLYPEEPYDDGGSPILRLDARRSRYFGEHNAEQVTSGTSHRVHPHIIEAAAKWAGELDVLERYLRIWHGTTEFTQHDTRDETYVTFDTSAWREEMGLPVDPAELAAYAALHKAASGVAVSVANMDEWIAYLEGDVYGYVVEENVEWVRADNPEEEMETWEHVDSCCGFYGREYAEQAAREALAEVAGVTA